MRAWREFERERKRATARGPAPLRGYICPCLTIDSSLLLALTPPLLQVRSLLVAVGIAEACRLRPRAPPMSPAAAAFAAASASRDKFERSYDAGGAPPPA